jgi:hypothetical protein
MADARPAVASSVSKSGITIWKSASRWREEVRSGSPHHDPTRFFLADD